YRFNDPSPHLLMLFRKVKKQTKGFLKPARQLNSSHRHLNRHRYAGGGNISPGQPGQRLPLTTAFSEEWAKTHDLHTTLHHLCQHHDTWRY
uniref:Uncharacterized protein n=1 Tax=Cyprinodon variegatus TaxID=28743 RepID=A0A3Q2CJ47_CYPVA